jgi:hypothetical protein
MFIRLRDEGYKKTFTIKKNLTAKFVDKYEIIIDNIDTAEQIRPGGFKQTYKSATTLQNLIQRDFTVTFKLGEGFINYWILYENIIKFLDFQNPEQYLQDFRLLLLDNEGVVMASVLLQQPIFTSLSEIQLNYASSTPQFSTFSIGFKCNYVDAKLEIG